MKLWQTALLLRGQGFGNDQLCLLGLGPRIAALGAASLAPEAERAGLASLASDVTDWPELGCARRLVASSGPVLQRLRCSVPAATGADRDRWLPARHFTDLKSGVAGGGVVLVVSARSEAQQAQAARALLHASSEGVKTYELAIGGPSP